jgi:hypothetical protein
MLFTVTGYSKGITSHRERFGGGIYDTRLLFTPQRRLLQKKKIRRLEKPGGEGKLSHFGGVFVLTKLSNGKGVVVMN